MSRGVPRGSRVLIRDLTTDKSRTAGGIWSYKLNLPILELHCDTTGSCGGIRLFQPVGEEYLASGDDRALFIFFRCRNCQQTAKTYAVFASCDATDPTLGAMEKVGESPAF